MRGHGRGRPPRWRGRGRGVGAVPQRSVSGGIALNYASVADFERDPLDAFSHSNRSSGRGQARFQSSNSRSAHHGGLGWAQNTLQDISNYSGSSSALLKPVKFVRGTAQELLKDPDAILLQPGVHDGRQRTRTESQPIEPSSSSTLPVAVEQAQPGLLPANSSVHESDDDDEEVVYVPPANMQRHIAVPSPGVANTDSKDSDTGHNIDSHPHKAVELVASASVHESSASLPPVSSPSAMSDRQGTPSPTPSKSSRRTAKRKETRRRQQARIALAREGDSDLEWGSDGPPRNSELEALTAALREKTISADESEGMPVDDDDLRDSRFAMSFVKSMANKGHISEQDIAVENALRASMPSPMPPTTGVDRQATASPASSASNRRTVKRRARRVRRKARAASEGESNSDREGASDRESWRDEDEQATSSDNSVDSDDSDEASAIIEMDEERMLRDALCDSRNSNDKEDQLDPDEQDSLASWLVSVRQNRGFDQSSTTVDVGAAQPPRSKGKGKVLRLPGIDSDDEYMNALQEQWQADRASKAKRRQARAAARAAAEPTKARRKKAKRETGDEANALKSLDLNAIHEQIRNFALDVSETFPLGLPPMSKRQRAAVHLVADAYGLSSKSIGKGINRSPILQRTARTAVHGVALRKIHSIIAAADGQSVDADGLDRRGRSAGLWRALGGDTGKVRGAHNREGAIVGHGAEALDEGNIGFQLLSRMGWSSGEKIGVSGGLEVPIVAYVKTSKKGLGH